ncbi:hypothetical protein ACQEVB_12625 [Pseudonocardia sp. CA-107938]|uniref:Rv3212 family protein n=1 Tax=Pseudonocardia sp. CA-107938 TaxID=3240021 RepID=UPI003D8B5585
MATQQATRPRRPAPERRTRGDLIAGAVLGVLVLAGAVVFGATSDAARTTSEPAAAPIVAPPPATGVPAAFTEAWRAPSRATRSPLVAGNAIVTADGSTVSGHTAADGGTAWTYERVEPLCTAGAGFGASADSERVLALYRNGEWCSELTALRPDTGTRAAARNPDLRGDTALIDNGTLVAGTGALTIEVMRSDLVRTLEYGYLDAPINGGSQPRPQCLHASTLLGVDRLAVIERCPGDATDRLSVIDPDDTKDGKPVERFSKTLPASGTGLVAISGTRVAVVVPDPARIVVFDEQGNETGSFPVTMTDAALAAAADPPAGVPATGADARQVSWWTGSSTVLLDPESLTPLATVDGTLGPGVTYGDATLVPVPDGLAVLGRSGTGPVVRTIPVARADRAAPVRLATQGAVLAEQRGAEVVALVPAR